MINVTRPKISAIIPAFNEELTVGEVVRVVKSSPLVDDVLVVSDGSTDNTVLVARAAGARILALPNNYGKGAAMRLGVLDTNTPIILFLDADLKGFTTDHIERLVWPVITGARAMNAAQRDRGWLNPIVRYLPLISGERAMKRELFLDIPEEYIQGFMVEIALNYVCRVKKLRFGSVLMPGLSIRRKYEKVGWSKGLQQYLRMTGQAIKAMLVVRLARLFKQF
ncbi:MAG: glycosyltransferase [Candidatus Uhrbacteria bacterium]